VKRRALLQALPGALIGCAGKQVQPAVAPKTGAERITGCVQEIGTQKALCPLPGRPSHSNIYDDALVVLVLLRSGRRAEAEKILLTLAAAQYSDGSIPFNLELAFGAVPPHIRSGALAWAGYAATEYIDAQPAPAVKDPTREKIVTMAHRVAGYLLSRQAKGEDPRAGLVLGGRGTFRYELAGRKLREIFVDGERDWASVEHNIDAFFFLKALARITANESYHQASIRIANALMQRAWDDGRGQFVRGMTADGADRFFTLDCASWGGLFLHSIGDFDLAKRCFAEADARYRSSAPHARGHKPYASGPLIESWALRQQAPEAQRKADWSTFQVVWPEGSAGVALLGARLGRIDRAREILRDLEPLRNADGSLPNASDEVEYELDRGPAIGGTAWVELVRIELDGGRPTLWT
jgi:hypothetical protein